MFKYISACLFFIAGSASAQVKQNVEDTSKLEQSNEVLIIVQAKVPFEPMNDIENTSIFAGKKSDQILVSETGANLATNNARQVFGKVAGVSVWENDGSGIQVSIATRGLNPNRSWEFNTRQNGYDISSDVFGYPEAYYNPPMEAVEKIQLVRGAASLQFGPQFGGLLNYVLARPTYGQRLTFTTSNTIGSNGMLSSYNAMSGGKNKWTYMAYHHARKGNGWRENGAYEVQNSHGFLKYRHNDKWSVSGEYTHMSYENQQSGGLTDAQFTSNSQQSFRARNWMSTPWNLGNVSVDFTPRSNLVFNLKVFGLVGERNSIGFVKDANIMDTIIASSLNYTPRQIDRDSYKNVGAEFRGLWKYNLKENESALAFGARVYNATTLRQQKGKGDVGVDYNLDLQEAKFPTEYNFTTKNAAVFAENMFKIGKKLSVTPGVRLEMLSSDLDGRRGVSGTTDILVAPQTVTRTFILSGITASYKLKNQEFYGNVSQSYRPVLFSDIVPPATTDSIDVNLKDAAGITADFGIRGSLKEFIKFDISGFFIQYNNRIGNVLRYKNDDITQNTYNFRTNVGQSQTMGTEIYVGISPLKFLKSRTNKWNNLQLYTSMAFINATYTDFTTYKKTGTAPTITIEEVNLRDKKVEYAPSYIHTFGVEYVVYRVSFTAQLRSMSAVFTDATNSEAVDATGKTGKLNAYSVVDVSGKFNLGRFCLKAGVNNLLNEKYATRRAGGFPGPGLIPGEGRTFFLGVSASFN